MKKLLLALFFVFGVALFAEEAQPAEAPIPAGEEEMKGFLVTKWCWDNSYLSDCKLETVACGSEGCFRSPDFKVGESKETMDLVLFIQTRGVYKIVVPANVKLGSVLKKGIGKNDVSVIGKVDHGNKTIIASAFKSPPPPKKSFFKGCL
jgi:hypothetical protein